MDGKCKRFFSVWYHPIEVSHCEPQAILLHCGIAACVICFHPLAALEQEAYVQGLLKRLADLEARAAASTVLSTQTELDAGENGQQMPPHSEGPERICEETVSFVSVFSGCLWCILIWVVFVVAQNVIVTEFLHIFWSCGNFPIAIDCRINWCPDVWHMRNCCPVVPNCRFSCAKLEEMFSIFEHL